MPLLRFKVLISVLSLISFCCCHNLYPEEPGNLESEKEPLFYDFTLSNSAGYNFDKSRPAFYTDFLKNLNTKFSIGFRIGLFTYNQNIHENAYEIIKEEFKNSNPGMYIVEYGNIQVYRITFVASINSRYRIFKPISVNLCVGAKQFSIDSYRLVLSFAKPNYGYPLNFSINEIFPVSESKSIVKAYYSAGVNYHLGRFEFGVYGDNIYSLGLNIGVSF